MPSAIGSFWEWVGALGHLDARLCGVVSRFKRGREIGLRAFRISLTLPLQPLADVHGRAPHSLSSRGVSSSSGAESDSQTAMSERRFLCRFLDAGGTKPLGTLGEPASKKRRGTKSRGVWGGVGSQRYGDLIFAPIMTVGAKLAPGGLDRVRKGSWKRALGISVAAWGVSTGGRIVDWRGFAERDRRRRRASAAERESGGARRRSGS